MAKMSFKIAWSILLLLMIPKVSSHVFLRNFQGTAYADTVADIISQSLHTFTKKVTNYDKITTEFQKIYNDGGLTLHTRKGEELIDDFTSGIDALFQKKSKLLQKIKKKAESTNANYKNNDDIANFNYFNTRTISKDDNTSLMIVPTFSKTVPINLTNSFVQVPTNIYSGNKGVLNTATWTAELDEVFMDNFNNQSDPTVLYQYYGDASGVFRIYPGNRNGESPTTDLYDCRRRVWYIQASSSPKDVVIVIDFSGSMIGNNIGIAKIAASSLIDTLQENDFFNVITISKDPVYIEPCVKYLVQATKENKEAMKLKIQEIGTPEGVTDVDNGIKEAFNILDAGPSYNRTSAECNRAIMFITDGVEGDYAGKTVFEERNKDQTTRAFAFLVGRIKGPSKTALIDMTCANRGFFYTIETLGNVWDTVLEYLTVLSRPMSKEEKQYSKVAKLLSYTPVYLDSAGLGMVMTVSLGVFSDQYLIGVAGTDVVLASLEEQIAKEKLGVFSHAFVINNNGFILLHPKFRDQTGYLPAPANVHLEDLERAVESNDSINLKTGMIDQIKQGQMSFQTYYIYDGDRRILMAESKYFYDPVNNTEFSAAVAMMEMDFNYLEVEDNAADEIIEGGLNALIVPFYNYTDNFTQTNWTYVQVAQWNYCNIQAQAQDEQPLSVKAYPTAEEIYNHIKEITNSADIPNGCDSKLIKKLLLTAAVVDRFTSESWQPDILHADNVVFNVDSVFTLTSGGYSKYFTNNNKSMAYDRDIYKIGIYEIAAANPDADIVVSSPHQTPAEEKPVYITTAGVSRVTKEKMKILEAISGMKASSNFFFQLLSNATTDITTLGVKFNFGTDFGCMHQGANDTTVCAILDQNGLIIASNQGDKYIGKFLGEILGPLMDHLATKNIFTKVMLDDTQAECPVPDEYDSAANILLTPAKLIFSALKLLLRTTYWVVAQIVILIIASFSQDTVKSQDIKKINISCTKEVPFYLFNETDWNEKKLSPGDFIREVECAKNVKQQYALSRIKGSNLMFIVANIFSQHCRNNRVTLTPVKKKDTSICNNIDKYRRKPFNCFNNTVSMDTDDSKCGRAGVEKPSLIVLLTALSIISFNYLR